MNANLSKKSNFLEDFQQKVIQGRRLLQSGNHRWADRLLTDLYFEIEKNDWLDIQKKHQLMMIISNSWWMYINSLIQRKEGKIDFDIIKYIDAYKRFFSFLSKIDDFYLFNNFGTMLLKSFINLKELSQQGITKYINSFSAKVIEKEEFQKLIELQILLMYLRKSVLPQEFFHYATEILGRTLFKLEPNKRALFLFIFLENVNYKYNLLEDSSEFVQIITKILANRLPGYLKDEFSKLSRISINERNFEEILVDLEDLIFYLNNIGEFSWIMIIIKNLFEKVQKFQSFVDAISYIRKFIDFAITRNRFEIAFEIYDFLEDLFMTQTDLGYDKVLIELWVEACKKFVDMKEKRYLLQALEKLNTHLKIPQTNSQLLHYFLTCNYLWQFNSIFFSLESKDFWRMMFYRALFEEKDYDLARKIIEYLDKNIRSVILDPAILYNETESLQQNMYTFEEKSFHFELEQFFIKQIIFRINRDGLISYRMMSEDGKVIDGRVLNEYWNDAQINEIYNDIFSDNRDKKYDFDLMEFGKLLYVFLPKPIRKLLRRFEIKTLTFVPEIYFILDQMTIPFELIYDNNFFLLKYSIGYIIGETPLGGVKFEKDIKEEITNSLQKYHVLLIDSVNSLGPFRWNETTKSKELIFPFASGSNEINFITEFFNKRNEVESITILTGINSTKEAILSNVTKSPNHVIHFVGNLFYSHWNPNDSFFITNDNQIITIKEILYSIRRNSSSIKPFLFFNTQVFDINGKKIKNAPNSLGDVAKQFDYEEITGIVTRNYPIFDDETKEINANFYINLFSKNNQGISLLKARQICMSNRVTKLVESKVKDLSDTKGSMSIDLQSSLAISSYMLFGKPWKKLS
ncbi:MAG: CHAT domain-containing protein [Promethearchaeota archaeon]